MKRILIVSYSFTPLNSPHAFRMQKLCDYWTGEGYRVDVICAWKPGLKDVEKNGGITIYRTGKSFIESLRKKGDLVQRSDDINGKNINRKKKLVKIIKMIYDFTWKKIYWPDYATLWTKSAVKQGINLLNKYNYEKVISVSIPFTSHRVAYKLRKQKKFNWIADYGDPFSLLMSTPVNNIKIYKKINANYEKRVNKLSNKILVTPEILEQYRDVFCESKEKIVAIPPLLTSKIDKNNYNENLFRKEKISMVFVGTLYREIRNPRNVLKIISNIIDSYNEVELYFVGNIEDCKKEFEEYTEYLKSNIKIIGIVPKNKAEEYISGCDILINISNKNKVQLPSKVVEYAATKKYILNFVSITDDNSVKFFRDYSKCINIFDWDNIDISVKKVENVINIIKEKDSINKSDINFIKEFMVDNVSKYY